MSCFSHHIITRINRRTTKDNFEGSIAGRKYMRCDPSTAECLRSKEKFKNPRIRNMEHRFTQKIMTYMRRGRCVTKIGSKFNRIGGVSEQNPGGNVHFAIWATISTMFRLS
jgi:hypothetical protein